MFDWILNMSGILNIKSSEVGIFRTFSSGACLSISSYIQSLQGNHVFLVPLKLTLNSECLLDFNVACLKTLNKNPRDAI